ncbi:hypothetical protein EGW08_000896 [Elysia chlorotica]|uniref:Integrase catalytic domain-containing protein n=1 Tax=Elysia chlorotica TaxID=188477 RepID=A0A3S1A5S2_ELYCH|nr:hypothetical protein EGW08_000896 [Elysia chlorotica]
MIYKLKALFSTHGLPDLIRSDNGPQFVSKEFKAFLRELGISLSATTSSPIFPQSNGMAESAVKNAIKLLQQDDPLFALMNYRATPHSSTGVSPAEALMNRKIRTQVPVGKSFLTVKNNEILIYNESKSIENLDADFKWHFLAVTWATDGTVEIVQDFSVSSVTRNGPGVLHPSDMYLNIYLGKSFFGYISQVSIWGAAFSTDELILMFGTPKAVPRTGALLLGWTHYALNPQVIQTKSSTAGRLVPMCDITGTIASPELTGCDKTKFPDKTPPMLTKECNETATITTDYNTHQVSVSSLGYEFKLNEGGITQNPQIYPEHFLTLGAHDVAVMAKDSEGNVGVCRTRTYVTPNHCEASEPEAAHVEACYDDDPHRGVEVKCPAGQSPSVLVPQYLVCGHLRSYNLENMYTRPDRIVCGGLYPEQ